MVCIVVHEKDDSLASQNHRGERGPVVDSHGDLWGKVGVLHKACLLNERHVLLDGEVVAIFKNDSDYVVGVRGYPVVDCTEIFGDRSSIEDIARSMAEMRGRVHEVHLSLQESDSIVQLCGYRESLVGSCITGFDEGRVVGGDFGNVPIFSGAEFGVIVAGRSVGGFCGGGCGC